MLDNCLRIQTRSGLRGSRWWLLIVDLQEERGADWVAQGTGTTLLATCELPVKASSRRYHDIVGDYTCFAIEDFNSRSITHELEAVPQELCPVCTIVNALSSVEQSLCRTGELYDWRLHTDLVPAGLTRSSG